MKHLLTFIFSFTALTAFSQHPDTILRRTDYQEYRTGAGEKTVTYHFVTDTIDALTTDDTFRIYLPHLFANAMAGVVDMSVDTIAGDTLAEILVGGVTIYEAQCIDDCPYDTTVVLTIPGSLGMENSDHDTFVVRNTYVWLEAIVASGRAVLEFWITLKPSSFFD